MCASYTWGREGAGAWGGPAAGVGADAGVEEEAAAGVGWKLAGSGEVAIRSGSLGPPGERAPEVLVSTALTFCQDKTQTRGN